MPSVQPPCAKAFHFSRTLAALHLAAYGSALAGVYMGLPLPVSIPLALVLLGYLYRQWTLHVTRSHPLAVVGLALNPQTEPYIYTQNGQKVPVLILKKTNRYTQGLLFLAFQGVENGFYYPLLLARDGCDSAWWSILWQERNGMTFKKAH